MVEAFRCSHCSAPVTDDRWTNCPYCGSVLDKPTIDPLKAVVAPQRFEAVERSREYLEAVRETPSGAGTIAGMGFRTVFLIGWTAVAGGMTVMALPFGPMAFVPALMGIAGVVLVIVSGREMGRFASAKTERIVAVVRDERTEVSGGGEHSSASTTHFLLLEARNGTRGEYRCDAATAGRLAPGDIGVAFVRERHLLDFKRVDA